ncbi:chromosome partitioning protein [Solwaraspora sp. WMMA2065]|uniref:MinD/ParA family ATP-binding protein n=1 Tax=Solwaraspora sp. WMMA2065 TaxID=3015166 RepID=UPI00259BCFF4|nr:chromosome partitioning protein [Solwaraspora sp. WMMA2065]WJK37887.1 chromosome partitioning protein [Solwaraspora sp. WMMA2065]
MTSRSTGAAGSGGTARDGGTGGDAGPSGAVPPAPRRSPEQPVPLAEQPVPPADAAAPTSEAAAPTSEAPGRPHPTPPRPGPTHPRQPHPGPSRPAPPPGQTPTPPPLPPPGPTGPGRPSEPREEVTEPAPGQPADPWAPPAAGPVSAAASVSAAGWDDWTPTDSGAWSPPAPAPTQTPAASAYQQVSPGVTELPRQPYQEAPGVHRMPSPPVPDAPVPPPRSAMFDSGYPVPPGVLGSVQQGPTQQGPAYQDPLRQPAAPTHQQASPSADGSQLPAGWTPESFVPTAEEFALRRATKPADPVATMGVRAALNRTTLGLVKLPPGQHEQEIRRDVEMVRRNFGGLRQVTVVNPKGGAGKTVAILMLAMTFGQKRGGYVLAWDNNETQGTLGMRAQQDFHSRTVRDMLRDLRLFQGSHGRVGDLSQYVRAQGEGMFDVLASDESATAGEMLTAAAFAEIREVVSRFYKLIFVDTGNNVRAQNWQAAIDATDQLVVTMSARNDSAEPAARMLDHLEQTGRQRLVRQAVTVISMPPSRREIDLAPIHRHFAARTRTVLLAPYERIIDSGEPIRYGQLSATFRQAWLKIASAVAEGL